MEDSKGRRGVLSFCNQVTESCWKEKHERGKLGLGRKRGFFLQERALLREKSKLLEGSWKPWGGEFRDLKNTGISQGQEENQQKAKTEDSSGSEGLAAFRSKSAEVQAACLVTSSKQARSLGSCGENAHCGKGTRKCLRDCDSGWQGWDRRRQRRLLAQHSPDHAASCLNTIFPGWWSWKLAAGLKF